MKNFYLIATVLGFAAPNVFVAKESFETGNILLWLDPSRTMALMFENTISTAFVVDLLVVVAIFFVWTYGEAKRYGLKNIGVIWILTMLFGMAGTFPLFLYLRHGRIENSSGTVLESNPANET